MFTAIFVWSLVISQKRAAEIVSSITPPQLSASPVQDAGDRLVHAGGPSGGERRPEVATPRRVSARLPELPRDSVDTAMPLVAGRTISVAPDGDLQRAINAAQPGDEVVLPAGATYQGAFVLPRKSGKGFVTIRSNGALPPPGSRVIPAHAQHLARIVASGAQRPALRTQPGASGYRLIGLEVTASTSIRRLNTLIALGDGSRAQDAPEKIPERIILDRMWIHGHEQLNLRRCVALNSGATAIIGSTIEACHDDGFDAQAVWGWNGPGPYLIENNYLEGSSENVGFGGGVPQIKGLVPSDIIIRRNHIAKPASWKGSRWLIKNLIEFKAARRVLIEANLIEGVWVHGQPGYALVFTPRSEDGACATFCTLQDVTFRYNHVRNIGSFLNLAADAGRDLTYPAARLRFEHNLIEKVNVRPFTAQGRLFLLQDAGLADVAFVHNTALGDDVIALFSGRSMHRIEFDANVLGSQKGYGLWGGGQPQGTRAIAFSVQDWKFTRNVVIGPPATGHPPGNWFVRNINSVGFVNAGGGDWRLGGRSRFRGVVSGRDPGANLEELRRRLEGVEQPKAPSAS